MTVEIDRLTTAFDLLQQRLNRRECLRCGTAGMPISSTTGFTEQHCALCLKQMQQEDQRRKESGV